MYKFHDFKCKCEELTGKTILTCNFKNRQLEFLECFIIDKSIDKDF